jgi:hypothetical protein
MNLGDIQTIEKKLIEAHPSFAAVGTVVIIDDGTYPKMPALEATLNDKGLAIVVWNLDSLGLIDSSKTGVSNQRIHCPVVIKENVKKNRGAGGTGITLFQALDYVFQAVSGYPKAALSGPTIVPHDTPFEYMGVENGALTIIADFVVQHRITPIYPAIVLP